MNVFHQLPTSCSTYGFTLIKSGSILSALQMTTILQWWALQRQMYQIIFTPMIFQGKVAAMLILKI
jgi:hypothetical protein